MSIKVNKCIKILVCMCIFVCMCLFLAYRLYTVVPRLVKFIDNLTNWYVRSNRKRLKVRISFILTSKIAFLVKAHCQPSSIFHRGPLNIIWSIVITMLLSYYTFSPFLWFDICSASLLIRCCHWWQRSSFCATDSDTIVG